MTTTICLLVSRPDHLSRVFHALEAMHCDANQTGLLVIVDGNAALYVTARNYTEQSRFASRLCVQYTNSRKLSEFNIQQRRIRISDIKNWSKQHIPDCRYVLGLEDDSVPPANTMERLLHGYALHPYAGFVSGVQIGRHGIPHFGAWAADDVYEPKLISSLMPEEGLQEVDAAGWFTYLTTRYNYLAYEYQPFDGNQLGPDVDWSFQLRRQGLLNYVDWQLPIPHYKPDGTALTLANTEPVQVQLMNSGGNWSLGVVGVGATR